MLAGEPPFASTSWESLSVKILSEAPPLEKIASQPDVAPALVEVVARCLAKEPSERFQTGADVEAVLRKLAGSGAPPNVPLLPRPAITETPAHVVPSRLEQDLARTAAGVRPDPTGPVAPVVLVVEDDPSTRAAYTLALEGSGFTVAAVGDGESALDLLASRDVDLVLMDVRLPGIDGFDVTRILRANAARRDLPVMLVSAHFDRSRIAFGLQAGATEIAKKPIAGEELAKKLWSLLSRSRPGRGAESGIR
jgi:CheY-like chemotaxis protein